MISKPGYCPTCGQRLPSVLDVDLTMNVVRRGLQEVRLEPQCAVLVSVLANNAGHCVTRERIKSALWGRTADGPPHAADTLIANYVYWARRSLASMGVRIRTIHRQGFVLTLEQHG